MWVLGEVRLAEMDVGAGVGMVDMSVGEIVIRAVVLDVLGVGRRMRQINQVSYHVTPLRSSGLE